MLCILQNRQCKLSVENLDDLETLENVLAWFRAWRKDCFDKVREFNSSAGVKELHSQFLTSEASEDFEGMLSGVIAVTKTYATRDAESDALTYFNPRTFSQDRVEQYFAILRLSARHMRYTATALHAIHSKVAVGESHHLLEESCGQKKLR